MSIVCIAYIVCIGCIGCYSIDYADVCSGRVYMNSLHLAVKFINSMKESSFHRGLYGVTCKTLAIPVYRGVERV